MEQIITNQLFYYLGFGIHKSSCWIDIFKEDNKYIVIMTDGSGTSVTNACETIATKVMEKLLPDVDIENIIWIEHYPKDDAFPDTYSKIDFEFCKNQAFGQHCIIECTNPKWTYIGEKLTEEDMLELLK